MKTETDTSPAPRSRRAVLSVAGALALGAALHVSWAAWRAHRKLVTLDMEVRQVVSKIESQTWLDIYVHQEVQGKITLKVDKMPVDLVMNMVAGQIFARRS